MPGVADAERRTRLRQDKIDRSKDREELLLLIKEGRLHEADERQLETIRLALELNQIMGSQQPAQTTLDTEALTAAMRDALADVISKLPTAVHTENSSGGNTDTDPARPKMRHVDLTTITHQDYGVKISQDETLIQNKESDEDSAEKLRRLKEIRGQK